MKKAIFILSCLFLIICSAFADQQQKQKISTAPIGVFACDCESPLTQAFNGFQDYIIGSNLQPLLDNFVDLYNNIENTTAELEAQQAELQNSNNVYKEKIIELEKYLYNLKKQKSILSASEPIISTSDILSIGKQKD